MFFWDRYRLIRPLGQGGMGVVFLARQLGPRGFERLVVIKALRPDGQGEASDALFREARLTAQLSHPNIVKIIDVDDADGVPHVVMEQIHGKTLSQVLEKEQARGGRIPLPLSAAIGVALCRALHHAHTFVDASGHPCTIIHRDVKASNALISFGGEVKLIDFGLAKAPAAPADTMTGELKGTLSSMSPEQARGDRQIDPRSDLFSLGVLLYRLLTNVSPFVRGSLTETVAAICGAQPEPPSALCHDLPGALDQAVMRCLAKRPEDRFSSARELQLVLQEFGPASSNSGSEEDLAAYLDELFPGERLRPQDGSEPGATGPRLAPAGASVPTQGPTAPTRDESPRVSPPHLVVVDDPVRPRKRGRRALVAVAGALAVALAVAVGAWAVRSRPDLPTARVEPRPDHGPGRADALAIVAAPAPPLDLGPVLDSAAITIVAPPLSMHRRHRRPPRPHSSPTSPVALTAAHGTLVVRSPVPGTVRYLGKALPVGSRLPLGAETGRLAARLAGKAPLSLEVSFERKARGLELTLDASPWAIVYVEGQRPGRTPFALRLNAAPRRLELRRPDLPEVVVELQYLAPSGQE